MAMLRGGPNYGHDFSPGPGLPRAAEIISEWTKYAEATEMAAYENRDMEAEALMARSRLTLDLMNSSIRDGDVDYVLGFAGGEGAEDIRVIATASQYSLGEQAFLRLDLIVGKPSTYLPRAADVGGLIREAMTWAEDTGRVLAIDPSATANWAGMASRVAESPADSGNHLITLALKSADDERKQLLPFA